MNQNIEQMFTEIGNGSPSIAVLQQKLSNLLQDFYGHEFSIYLSLPWLIEGKQKFVRYNQKKPHYQVCDEENIFSDGTGSSFVIDFPDLQTRAPCVPKMGIVCVSSLEDGDISDIKSISIAYTRSTISNITKNIRRSVIHSKVKSNDLGSFIYRLINEENVNKYFSSQFISIFVRDWIGQIIRLRGTNASLISERKISDIRFHATDNSKKIVTCHLNGSPVFEFSPDSDLLQNGDSHEMAAGGVWSRLYWPIKLTNETELTLSRVPDRSNDGVIRLTNCIGQDGQKIPFMWPHVAALEFFSETLFIIVDAFSSADEAGFKKDEAFHNSMSVVDTIIRSIESFIDSIYNPGRLHNKERPARFMLTPLKDNKHIQSERVLRLLRTAYASAKDISFQIARANDDVPYDPNEITHFLVRDVLIRAVELVPDMCTAHSAIEGWDLPRIGDMVKQGDPLPPPVRGAPEALVSVFANIFENSVKYRKPGSRVEISVEISDTDTDVLVSVRDKGVGVKDAELQKIFNRGWRGENAQFAPRGSGLGLSWSESVLRSFGGVISADSHSDGLAVLVRLKKVV